MGQSCVFLGPYDETLDLIVEARHYVAFIEPPELRRRNFSTRLSMSREAMRVTARLTETMAWLMLQRAVAEGDAAPEILQDENNRLSDRGIYTDHDAEDDRDLPPALRSLLDRSRRLYERVARLEHQAMRRVVDEGPTLLG